MDPQEATENAVRIRPRPKMCDATRSGLIAGGIGVASLRLVQTTSVVQTATQALVEYTP